ncbi:hypothetical protein KIN20_027382, partial [Parelaphostrongylus tenuis]
GSLECSPQEAIAVQRLLPRILQGSYKLDVVIRRAGLPFSRNLLYRTIQLSLRNQRAFRPITALAIHYRRLYNDRLYSNRAFHLAVRKRNTPGIVERIRDVFSTSHRYNAGLSRETFPNTMMLMTLVFMMSFTKERVSATDPRPGFLLLDSELVLGRNQKQR